MSLWKKIIHSKKKNKSLSFYTLVTGKPQQNIIANKLKYKKKEIYFKYKAAFCTKWKLEI